MVKLTEVDTFEEIPHQYADEDDYEDYTSGEDEDLPPHHSHNGHHSDNETEITGMTEDTEEGTSAAGYGPRRSSGRRGVGAGAGSGRRQRRAGGVGSKRRSGTGASGAGVGAGTGGGSSGAGKGVTLEDFHDDDDEEEAYYRARRRRPLNPRSRAVITSDDESSSNNNSEDEDDDDDDDEDTESLIDRIVALKDMIPIQHRERVSRFTSGLVRITTTAGRWGGKAIFVLSTGALLVGVPYALAVTEEQGLVEMEREMKLQQSANELISSGSTVQGLQQGGGQGKGGDMFNGKY